MKFNVHLHSISCSGLTVPDRSSARPYVRFNFDGYKKVSTHPLRFPSSHSLNDASYPDSFTFAYETQYPQKVHQKALSIKALSKNSILADTLLGSSSVDLHTLFTGPAKQSLVLLDAKRAPVGRVHFICEVEQVCNVSLRIQSVALSSLPPLQRKTPISHLQYFSTALDSSHKRYKTDKQSNTVTPVFPTFQPIKFSGTLQTLWREGVELHVMVKARSRDKSHKMGSVTLRISAHPSFTEKEPLSVVERVVPTPDYAHAQCVMRLHLYYEGMPSFVQMTRGLHDERGVHDAVPFAEGLPLPRTAFFETKLPVVVGAPAVDSPPLPTSVPVQLKGAEGARRRLSSEKSVMSIKAAREYDGASVIRRDSDNGGDSPPPACQVKRPSSSLALDSTAAFTHSAPMSRAISRSSSSGDLPASALPRPTTPGSQKRYLAYPPPPPPKPEPTAAVRVSLRALSISDPMNPFNEGDPRRVSWEADRSPRATPPQIPPRDSPRSVPSPKEAPGKFGYCAVCSRPAAQVCAQVMVPVCSYACKVRCLMAHGLAEDDDEKERPPASNPQVSLVTAYPALAASPVARQPGPAGFCVVCHHAAVFMCRDTLVPVCSAECKAVNLRLNPHLKGAGGRVVEPSAPLDSASAFAAPSPSSRRTSQPLCVVCGGVSDFRCSVTGAAVCSKECKAANLDRAAQMQPLVDDGEAPGKVECPTCTLLNDASAAVCDICASPLQGPVEPPSPDAPVYHLHLQQGSPAPQHRPPPVPHRPSFAPVSPTGVAVAPGGPLRR